MQWKWIILSSLVTLTALTAGTTKLLPAARRLVTKPASATAEPHAPPPREAAVIRGDGRVVAGRGGQVVVGAELSGTIDQVLVQEGSVVRAGETLAVFRAGEQLAAVHEANAYAREASAAAQSLEEEAQQTKELVEGGSLPREALRKINHQRDAARARRAAATATTSRLAAGASRAKLVAPIAGTVILRKVEPGETVTLGTQLFVVADLSQLRVEAEIDEFDALRVRSAMKARVKVDGTDGEPMKGSVGEIGLVIAPRGIRPQDPARPLDAQVLKVKVVLEPSNVRLKLGQRVSVTLTEGDTI
jgi:RND family efflux transporter MFP subunit